MVGANPLVSHGSVLSAPRVREQLHAIVERGGRVVVVDPRRTETARQFEHLPIRPDADAWLLLSLLNVDLRGGARRPRASSPSATEGAGGARARWRARIPPEATEARTGMPAERVRAAGARLRGAPTAPPPTAAPAPASGRFGTLVAFLLDALNAVTGQPRPARRRGVRPPADRARRHRRAARPRDLRQDPLAHRRLPRRDRQPARRRCSPREIETPGERQIRAFFVSAGNPVLSVPDGDALERALGELDLMVSLDFYVNETNRHADYVLPGDHLPRARGRAGRVPGLLHARRSSRSPRRSSQPRRRGAPGVADRSTTSRGGSASRPTACRALRRLARLGLRLTPAAADRPAAAHRARRATCSACAARGLSLRQAARAHPHGIVLDDHVATGVLAEQAPPRGRGACASRRPRSSTRSSALAAAERRRRRASRCG